MKQHHLRSIYKNYEIDPVYIDLVLHFIANIDDFNEQF